MFQILRQKFGKLDAIEITNDVQNINLQVIHGFGAIINKFTIKNSPFSFISGYEDFNDLIEQHPYYSRSAKLFPFSNRLENGRYSYQSNNYTLPSNFPWSEHAVHGLLYNQPFDIINSHATEQSASITLRYSTHHLHSGYPFAFQIDITYRIDLQCVLSCTTKITNLDNRPLPFGDACHPYFSLGCKLEKTTLTMPSCQKLQQIDGLPNGHSHLFTDFAQPCSLAERPLDDCFEFETIYPIQLSFERMDKVAKLTFTQDASYRFIQLYTPSSESSLAIEPMTCPANAFNNQIGLLFLTPGESSTFHWQCQAQYTP